MSPAGNSQQQFTFINVNEAKRANTRTIKRHVSNQTNRRKRQEAITQYQQSLITAAVQSTTLGQTSPESSEAGGQSSASQSSPSTLGSLSDYPTSPEYEDDHRDENSHQPIPFRPAAQYQFSGYWPSYQRWALVNLKSPPSSPEEAKHQDQSIAVKPLKKWTVSHSPAQSGISMSESDDQVTIHIPRINPPAEHSRMGWAIQTGSGYIRGMYEKAWRPVWQDKQWFQGSLLPLGIWRECFPLSVEFIQAGKMQEAFFILNAALSVTPAFFSQNHPGLLIAILGAFMYTCQIADDKLSTLIRTHVTQLSIVHLGPLHPISLLLREQVRATETAQGRTDILALAVMDTFQELFGKQHFVPLSMRFGYVRRQLSSGDYGAALSAIATLEKTWNIDTMPGGQLPTFLAFEKAKVLNAQQRARLRQPLPKSPWARDLGDVAEDHVQLPIFVPGRGPVLAQLDSAILKKLGKHLLLGSHYALALYIFTRIPEVFAPFANKSPNASHDPDTLPNTVARILVDHLKNESEEDSLREIQKASERVVET